LSHPNIVGSIDFYKDEFKNEIHQVLEYIPGSDLSIYLEKHGAFSEEEAKPIFRQVLEGLKYLHSHKVCNRDIKPANIMLHEQTKRAVIIDFNVSKMAPNEDDSPDILKL
jgi:serine/threonine protein kinase